METLTKIAAQNPDGYFFKLYLLSRTVVLVAFVEVSAGETGGTHVYHIIALFQKIGIIRVVSQELAIQMGLLQFFYKKMGFPVT